MGKPTSTSPDAAVAVVESALAAADQATGWLEIRGGANFAVGGTFVGEVVLERSFDGGATALPVMADGYGSIAVFTTPCTGRLAEDEPGVLWRLRCRVYTSGPINARISR